jgi:sigma-E factor negative regulatory protein RseC
MEKGIVVKIDGGRILVEAARNASCKSCSAAGSCSGTLSNGRRRIWMENNCGAGMGDEVAFFFREKAMIAGSLVLYAVPAVMLIAGIVLGASLSGWSGTDRELSSIAGGSVGLIMSYVITRIASSASKKRELFMPLPAEVTERKTN